jgi:amidase
VSVLSVAHCFVLLGTLISVLSQSAMWFAREIRTRRISALEVMQRHLERIESMRDSVNATVQILSENALATAHQIDARLGAGDDPGPLAGVPFSIKDSIDVCGTKCTAGTWGRRGAVPAERDAILVQRLKAAGAIPIAKTNLPDLLFSFETDNFIYGRTNNPYDLTRTPGGSSGGESALIAAGGSPLGLGSDAFGSVRLPAAFCGLAAIKPTSGRLPRTGHVPGPGGWAQGVWQIGPMARRVEDVQLAMRLLAYPDGEDLWSPPVPLVESTAELRQLRVAYFTHNGFATCTTEVVAAVETCARFLAQEGANVIEERPPGLENIFDLEMAFFGADGAEGIDAFLSEIGTDRIHPLHANFVNYMRPHKAGALEFAVRWAQWDAYRAGLARFFSRYDVILCPAYTQTALPHGASMKEENFRGFSYTMAWNMGQTPAATVRCAEHDGLPINVQVVAKPWDDMLTLRVCEAIEKNFGGWQAPPLSACL